jgi:hypothetical protein
MAKRRRQVGGRKEAPLAVVGSGLVPEQHKKIFKPEDAEYQRYSELLQFFFEKFTRWQGVLSTEEYIKDEERRSGSVFRLDTGFTMTPDTSMAKDDPANKILQITNIMFNDPEPGLFDTRFIIRPAPAGKHLLIDPEDNKPLEPV